jgi:hypothetical protein
MDICSLCGAGNAILVNKYDNGEFMAVCMNHQTEEELKKCKLYLAEMMDAPRCCGCHNRLGVRNPQINGDVDGTTVTRYDKTLYVCERPGCIFYIDLIRTK